MKGRKISHSSDCEGGRCRGGCRKGNTVLFTGATKSGKSAYAFEMARKSSPEQIHFDVKSFFAEKQKRDLENPNTDPLYKSYLEGKAQRTMDALKRNLPPHRNHWEVLGRLLGMAYADGDESFYAALEGFHAANTNEREGRRSMGGPK